MEFKAEAAEGMEVVAVLARVLYFMYMPEPYLTPEL